MPETCGSRAWELKMELTFHLMSRVVELIVIYGDVPAIVSVEAKKFTETEKEACQDWRILNVFLTLKALCTKDLFHRARQQMSSFDMVLKTSLEIVEVWANEKWVLHHDSTPAHTSLIVHQFQLPRT